jgi:hypothetical protein
MADPKKDEARLGIQSWGEPVVKECVDRVDVYDPVNEPPVPSLPSFQLRHQAIELSPGWSRLQNRSIVQLHILSMRSEVRAQSLANKGDTFFATVTHPRFEGNPGGLLSSCSIVCSWSWLLKIPPKRRSGLFVHLVPVLQRASRLPSGSLRCRLGNSAPRL